VTLLAFATERRGDVRHAAAEPGGRRYRSWPARRAHSSNPRHAAAAVDSWDRQTDRHRTVTWSLPHTMMNAAYIQQYGPFHGRRQRVLMHITVRHANERLQQ